jgi:hypothetical protein
VQTIERAAQSVHRMVVGLGDASKFAVGGKVRL